ncbi:MULTISPECIES: hypothetical protein [Oerskovia]|uniref:LPXTG cell wall anchor domain-containing protein n=2 Tax=Oerskovia TaxID=162491 RepID=A0ABR8V6S1_9CELL|nr:MULTISPECIES: hypothetical protein [Oerskovia]MBD8000484.1 hypothetical protein [Oerskovia gallyi]MBM7498184.1 hypothetical protein [Oerskovia paurometabola]
MSDMTQQQNRHTGPDRARTPRPRARSGPLTRALGRVRAAAAAGMALLLGTLLATVLGAVPASAHGGDIILSIGGDGAGGISVNVTYKTDGHPVEEIVDVMVTAVSDAGTEIGPLQLSSASEGVGWYTSAPDVLTDGHWTVTATTTTPVATTATSQIDVVPPPAAPAPAEDGAQDGAEGDASGEGASAAAASDEGSGVPTTALVVGGVVLLLAAGAVLVLRRRATATKRP